MFGLIAFSISLISGLIGITIGVVSAYSISNRGKRFEGAISGFTGGLMMSIVYIDILPEAFDHSGLWVTIIGLLLGIIFITYVDNKIDSKINKERKTSNYIKTALLITIGLALHNIPEGIAIGSLLSYSMVKGLKFGILITIHNIPEGLMIAVPLKKTGASLKKVIFISFAISFFMGFGGYIGYVLSSISSDFIAISLGIAGGIMLYITCSEILMKCSDKWKGRSVILSVVVGILVGIVISY